MSSGAEFPNRQKYTLTLIIVLLACVSFAVMWFYESDSDRGKRAGILPVGITEQEVLRQVGTPTREHRVDLKANLYDVCSRYPAAVRALEYDIPSEGSGAHLRKLVGAPVSRMSVVCVNESGQVVGTNRVQF